MIDPLKKFWQDHNLSETGISWVLLFLGAQAVAALVGVFAFLYLKTLYGAFV
jgi:hypothetical protein